MDHDFFYEDALDRRAALTATIQHIGRGGGEYSQHDWVTLADHMYFWLRQRQSLRAVRITITPGTPVKENTMTAQINLEDDDEATFSLTGADAKGATVPAPTDTWNWTLTDPDASGAVLTVATSTATATVAAGTPTPNLNLSVTGQNTGLTGAEAIIVTPGPAQTITLVAGTPTPES